MEANELEEGEACTFQNINDSSRADPDVSLSYIDEKLQNVLGHLQKDFEGGVSAENLGAKFGGYGSFLPTYQRSPILSHPRSPQNVQNHSTSPNYPQLLGGHCNPALPASAPLPVKHGPETVSTEPLLSSRALSGRKSIKRDVGMLPTHTKGFNSRYEITKNSSNPQDHKMLKLRIKVGSDNLSTRKNDAIYSGLGLDISPSSSVGDSPAESEDRSHKPQDGPHESPNSILRIMTSFPVIGGILLSPLPDDLIFLAEKEKLWRDRRSGSVPVGGCGNSVCLVNGSDSLNGGEQVLELDKMKSAEKKGILLETHNGHSKDARNAGGDIISQKEGDIDASASKDIVSKALKLPFLCTSHFTGDDPAKDTIKVFDVSQESKEGVVKEKYNAELAKEDSISTEELGYFDKQTEWADSAGKSWEDRMEISIGDIAVYPRKDTMQKGEKSYESLKTDSKSLKEKTPNSDLTHFSKLKTHLKSTSHKQNGMNSPLGNEVLSSGRKEKSKVSRSRNTLGTAIPLEDLKVGSKANKKGTPFGDHGSNIESEKITLQKDSGKAGDRYRDFFGDLSLEQEENEVDSLEIPFEGRLEESESTSKFVSDESKEGSNGKEIEKPLMLESNPGQKAITDVAPAINGPTPEATPTTVAPEVIQENWVACDKCQKWRLLPFGTNPDSLPEKWVCSMLNWLPGMNRCSLTEEETTRALISLYQVPVSENQSNFYGHPDGILSGLAQSDTRHSGQNHRRVSSYAEPNSAKKRHGSIGISNANDLQGPAEFTTSMKTLQPSVKSRGLNEANQPPLVNQLDKKHLRASTELTVEKQKHKKNEKHKLLEQFSDGGDKKNSKIKNKRGVGQDKFGASKKLKTEGKHDADEGWISESDHHIRNGGSSSTDVLPIYVIRKDHSKYDYSSSFKDSDFDGNGSLQVASGKTKDQVRHSANCGSHEIGRVDSSKDFLTRKRKVKDSKDFRESPLKTRPQLQDITEPLKEEFSENDDRKEKKTRLNANEVKGGIVSAGIEKTEKRSDSANGQKLGQAPGRILSQRSLDGMDSLNRDIASVETSVPATSSSSKVSGSRRNKTKLQDVKGSPVESVSSSPLRSPNKHEHPFGVRNFLEKDPFSAGFLTEGSPRRCLDGENDGGSDRSGTDNGKDKIRSVNNHESLEFSVVDMQNRDHSHLPRVKAKEIFVASTDFKNEYFINGVNLVGEQQAMDRCDEEIRNNNHYHNNESLPRKVVKGSSSRSKDKNRNSKSNIDKSNPSGSFNESQDHVPSCGEKPRDRKNKLQQKPGVKSHKVEKKYVDRRDSAGRLLSETSKIGIQSKSGARDGHDVKGGARHSKDASSTLNQSFKRDKKNEGSSMRSLSEKTDRVDIGSGRSTSMLQSLSAGGSQNDNRTYFPQQNPGSLKGNGADILSIDAFKSDDAMKRSKQAVKCDKRTGDQHNSSRDPTPNGHRVRDLDAPSPLRRYPSSQVAENTWREAKNLKHMADRLKNHGSGPEGTRLYFEASLKFLDAASLFESCYNDGARHGDLARSRDIYCKTAKICEFCACEFEKSRDMATAALAYKCAEVACLRVIYSLSHSANRDRAELQNIIETFPPGESPSSSASDIDNLNNVVTVDKVSLAKDVSSPQVAGNQIISAQNRPTFMRLLNFIQETTFGLEASKKSWIAFEAANASLEQTQSRKESIASIKRALDFSFQDVECFIRLVRVAMEALGH